MFNSTDELVEYLKVNIPTLGVKKCSQILNMKSKELRQIIKTYKLPLRKTHVTKNGVVKISWSEEELEILNKYYNEGGSEECKKYLPNRALQDIRTKARRIGLYYKEMGRFYSKGVNNKRCADHNGYIKCLLCNEEKLANVDNFTYRKDRKQFQTICRVCKKLRYHQQRSNDKRFLQRCWRAACKRRPNDKNITYEEVYEKWLEQERRCAITGVEMTCLIGKGRQITNATLDRIDNTKGYEKDNVQIVCLWANIAKNDLKLDTFLDFCKKTIEYNIELS